MELVEKREEAKQKRRKDRLFEDAKDEVDKRNLILERDLIIRRQKFKDMLVGKVVPPIPEKQFDFISP